MAERLRIREITADELAALLPIYLSNPAFVEQNEGQKVRLGAMILTFTEDIEI